MIAVEQPRDFIADNEVPVFIAAAIASCTYAVSIAIVNTNNID